MSRVLTGQPSPLRQWAALVGAVACVLPILIKVQTPLEYFPLWDGDPLNQAAVTLGLTPALALTLDALGLAGAALLVGSVRAPVARSSFFGSLALLLAAAVSAAHALQSGTDPQWLNARSAVVSGSWAGALATAAAVVIAAGRPGPAGAQVRVLLIALIAGVTGLLAAKGLHQIAVEHPATLAEFRTNREQIFARNGWTADSPMARAFERRATQSEASGWFGMANVYASLGAMAVCFFAPMTVGAFRSFRRAKAEAIEPEDAPSPAPPLLLALGTALGAAMLVMSGAKGGFAAALAGLLAVGSIWWLARTRRALAAALVIPGLVAATLAAVVARGIVGERLSELSIYFRWFYMQAATRVFAQHPLEGVGPDGFQEAYLKAKNPLSPEDVTSPHSIMFDWAACLGIAGVLCAGWFMWACARAGRNVAVHPVADGPQLGVFSDRSLMRAACAALTVAAVISIPTQYAGLLPLEAVAVRIGGLVLSCVLACGIIAGHRTQTFAVALAGGAAALAVHTQIEVTAVFPQSAALLLAVVSVSAAPRMGPESEPAIEHSRNGSPLPSVVRWPAVALTAAVCAALLAVPARAWQSKLQTAYEHVRPVAQLRADLRTAMTNRSPQAQSIAQELRTIELSSIPRAAAALPRSWPGSRAASQLLMEHSGALRSLGTAWFPRSDTAAQAAVAVVLAEVDPQRSSAQVLIDSLLTPDTSGTEPSVTIEQLASVPLAGLPANRSSWLVTVARAAADQRAGQQRDAWLMLATVHARHAMEQDPYNPVHAVRMLDLLVLQGDTLGAQTAAKQALDRNLLQRLDASVRGLTAAEEARARAAVGQPVPGNGR